MLRRGGGGGEHGGGGGGSFGGGSFGGGGGGLVWRLDKLGNRVSYKRQLQAINTIVDVCERARAALSKDEPPPPTKDSEPSATVAAALTARDHGASAEHLRTLCARLVAPHAAAAVDEAAFRSRMRLNESQQRAARAAATGCFTLVQGPPGTGKTAMSMMVRLASPPKCRPPYELCLRAKPPPP